MGTAFRKNLKKNNISLDFNEIYREKKLTYFFSTDKELKFKLIANPLPTGIIRFNLRKIMVQNWTFTYDLET